MEPSSRISTEEKLGPSVDSEPLTEIDEVLMGMMQDSQRSARHTAEHAAHDRDTRQQFLDDFDTTCREIVRPVMQEVRERLQHNGGGALIDGRPGDNGPESNPRLTMWMSLDGDILEGPRPEQHSYLRFEADVSHHEVHISEPDRMSGVGYAYRDLERTWQLSEVTRDLVARELLAILQRARP